MFVFISYQTFPIIQYKYQLLVCTFYSNIEFSITELTLQVRIYTPTNKITQQFSTRRGHPDLPLDQILLHLERNYSNIKFSALPDPVWCRTKGSSRSLHIPMLSDRDKLTQEATPQICLFTIHHRF